MASSEALSIAVLGAGRIGSALAFQLARTGHHEVTMVARPGSSRLRQLQRDGAIVDVEGRRADVRVVDALDEHAPYDLLLVTVLAHQADAVLPVLRRSAAGCVLFLFNNFDPEPLQDAVGAERCCFGMPFLQANFDGDGRLRAKIGAAGQKSLLGQQRWVDVFLAAGLPAVFEPKMTLWLRCHAPLCVAFESASVAGVRRGGGASWDESMMIARGVRESFTLIERLGYTIYPAGKVWLRRCPVRVVGGMLWSMSRIKPFRELLATGIHECRALVDALAAAAPRANPPVSLAILQAMKPSEETMARGDA